MNSTFRRILVIAALVAGAGFVLFIGNNVLARGGGPFGWPSGSMMGGNGNHQSAAPWMGGMMDGGTMQQMMGGAGMMSNGSNMMNGGMMGYSGTLPSGMGTMMAGGMMMGFGSSELLGVKPLSVDRVTGAVNAYLAKLGNQDLVLAEVVIFDNNGYARIIEKSTGAGAFEVLVNPATQAVYPEPGPNMMWNTKYSPMRNMMGGMMGSQVREPTTVMPLSTADALKTAQAYLDKNLPGAKTAEDADTFYGYYTIDILRNGKVAGMLSVNGYTGQVFLHTWHGNFVEISEGK